MHTLYKRISCDTMGVIYLLNCVCGAFYIGKTKRQLRQRIGDHLFDIQVGRLNKPIPRHIGLVHKYNPQVLSCRVLEHVPLPSRGGNWDKSIL